MRRWYEMQFTELNPSFQKYLSSPKVERKLCLVSIIRIIILIFILNSSAVGTGLNTYIGFDVKIAEAISRETGY
jgi:fumarate hydratase class II